VSISAATAQQLSNLTVELDREKWYKLVTSFSALPASPKSIAN